MERSDYEYSLRALDYWMDDLERVYRESQDPDTEEILLQVDKSFNNIFKLFKENYKQAMNNMSPDLEEIQKRQPSQVEISLKREVSLPSELVLTIQDLVEVHKYGTLKDIFEDSSNGKIYIDTEEAEALITLATIEKQKAALKFPGYDRTSIRFNEMDEIRYFNVQQNFYNKIVEEVCKSFDTELFEHIL